MQSAGMALAGCLTAGTRAGDAAGPEGLRRGTRKAGGDADPTGSLPDNCDDGAEEGLQTLDALFPMLAGLADDAGALDDAMDHSSPDFQFPTGVHSLPRELVA